MEGSIQRTGNEVLHCRPSQPRQRLYSGQVLGNVQAPAQRRVIQPDCTHIAGWTWNDIISCIRLPAAAGIHAAQKEQMGSLCVTLPDL